MRNIASAALLILLVGCQVRHRQDPVDLSVRLEQIENRRLGKGDSNAQGSPGNTSVASANGVARLDNGNPGEAATGASAGITLGEFGEQDQFVEGEDAELADNPNAPYETDQGNKEELYARRPPLESFWDTVKRDVKVAHKDLWRDTKRVYANPLNLVILGTTYGGALAIQETGVDDSIEQHFNTDNDFERGHHHFKEDWRDAFGAVGNPATHFALAGAWYLLGQQTMDDKTYEVGKTLFSALMINGITVMVGQAATWDRAPNGEYGTFPSGHTSSSFVFASVMHEAYGHLVGVPLYALAGLAGYERIEDGEHYFSDVVMGGVLGLVVGHSVASGRDPEFFGWKLMPYASPGGGAGVAFMKTFD